MRLIKEYCCCAIPLLNAGIYMTLTAQFVASATAGVLTLVTPPIVGMVLPSFAPIVFAALCFVGAAVQLFGYMGVSRESTIVFRRYTTLHLLTIIAIFAYSAVFLGISASKHNTSVAKCIISFFPADPNATPTALTSADSEGKLLCDVFTWVGIGTLAGLWVVMATFHTYLYFVVSGYGSSQRDDHSKYYSLYSLNPDPDVINGLHPPHPADTIGMHNMGPANDAWDTHDSVENVGFEKPGPYPPQPYVGGPATYPPLPQRHGSDATSYSGPARSVSRGPTPGSIPRGPTPGPIPRGPTPGYQNMYGDPYYENAAAGRGQPGMPYTYQ